LFAVERLFDAAWKQQQARPRAITEALDVDPLLAGEMIFRSAACRMDRVKSRAIDLANRGIHQARVDRAVRFMITTGKSDFSGPVWSLIRKRQPAIATCLFSTSPRPLSGECVEPRDRDQLPWLPDDQRRRVLVGMGSARAEWRLSRSQSWSLRAIQRVGPRVRHPGVSLSTGGPAGPALLNQADDTVWGGACGFWLGGTRFRPTGEGAAQRD